MPMVTEVDNCTVTSCVDPIAYEHFVTEVNLHLGENSPIEVEHLIHDDRRSLLKFRIAIKQNKWISRVHFELLDYAAVQTVLNTVSRKYFNVEPYISLDRVHFEIRVPK